MKHSIHLAVLSFAISLGGVTAVLADQDGSRRGATFETLDTDGNGQLTRAELQARHDARFARADADGDGALTAEEIEASMKRRHSNRVQRMIDRHDANGDGKLTLDELKTNGRGDKMFERADADGNGTVSKEEFETARAELRKYRGGEAKRKRTD